MFTSVAIIHGIIGLVSLAIVIGTFKFTSRKYYIVALAATVLVTISGLAIRFAGLSHWWRIALETLATAIAYGAILYKNRANIKAD